MQQCPCFGPAEARTVVVIIVEAKITWNEWIQDLKPAAQAGGSELEHCSCRCHNLKPTNILSLLFVT